MGNISLKHRTLKSMIWNAVQRFGSIGIYFLANIILVRLIDPEVFGSIGILLIFVSISTSIVDGGFSSALIQQKNIKQVDYSTVFYWSIVASLVMMCIIWLVSPIVAEYYNTPILNKVLRVQSVLFLFHALGVVQNAKLTKELSFRTLATRNIIASASGAVIAVVMAYNGYGIWSIVAQELVMAIVGTTLLWISCKWIPTLEFSRRSFLRMFKFGSYVFLSTIIDTLYRNVQSLIIGRRFSMMELGYYTQARKLENVPIDSASSVVASVLFPALSSINNDYDRLKMVVRKSISVVTFASFPAMLLLAIVGEQIILFLYGAEWSASIPMYQILCLGSMFYMLNVCNATIFKIIGEGRVYFILQTVKRVVCLVLLLLSVKYGLFVLLWTTSLTQIVMYAINMVYTHRVFKYTYREQLKDIVPNLIITLCCGILTIIVMCNFEFDSNILSIIINATVYSIFYYVLSRLFKTQSLQYVASMLK